MDRAFWRVDSDKLDAAAAASRGKEMTAKTDPLQRESFRCTADEKEAGQAEAARRGMTWSQLVRLGLKNETKRGKK